MRELHVVLPGPIDTATGGYRYDRHVIHELRALGWHVTVHELPAEFPFPTALAREAATALLAAIPDGSSVLFDGLALGVLADEVQPHRERLRLIGLVHHPLSAETGLSTSQAEGFFDSERRALENVRALVVTSAATAELVRASGLSSLQATVIVPGTTPAPLRAARSGTPTRLLCVATLTPRKCHALLLDALAEVRDLPWTLDCVGNVELHVPTVEALLAQRRKLGLDDRVRLLGERSSDELRELHLDSDVFVLPSAFEGYGMAVAEALAQGVPVIATRTGAAAELVDRTCGRLIAPGDPVGLVTALREVLRDVPLREQLASGARTRASTLPRWADSAARLASVVEGVAR
ncbi:MAG: glycosyltransferase family 4 protein [Steroidobacteraceae bacterium]